MFDDQTMTASNRTVAALLQYAGMERPEGGFTLRATCELLQRCEYVVNPDDLLRLVDRGRVILADGVWCDHAIHCAVAYLEGSRRWQACSDLHRLKKSPARLLIEEHGDDDLREDVADKPLREFLLLLTACENRGLREGFLEAVLCKLATLEVNIDD